jgi:ATP adenylyltransferase
MEQIWAPWRAEYFKIEKPTHCIFCAKSSQKDDLGKSSSDEANYVLLRERTCFVLLNAYPYTGGHLMVAPYRHTGELNDLTDDELKDIMRIGRRCKNLLQKALRPDGFNIGMNLGTAAGAGIAEHLHLHIVPRWNGDTNFMTVLSDNRIISEGLKATFDKLMSYIKEVDAISQQ